MEETKAMEETLGKRVAAHRRRLGLTQDRLAELLGVTAQAVSKWENDQSCPDIAMLPKLADIFGCTTDELLGIGRTPVHDGELVPQPKPEDNEPGKDDKVRAVFNGEIELEKKLGRKDSILMAVWVLLTGSLLLLHNPHTDLWGLLWRTGLLIFGIGGLWPRFSFFRLACALFGGYALMNYLVIFPEIFNRDMGWMLPAFLLLFGLHLLIDAFHKPGKRSVGHIAVNSNATQRNRCDIEGEAFDCFTSFGEHNHRIDLPRLSRGKAAVCFGSLTVDLGGCQEIAESCRLDLDCSFGNLELILPRRIRAVPDAGTTFGNVEFIGAPAPDAADTITVKCDASFGQITLRYV